MNRINIYSYPTDEYDQDGPQLAGWFDADKAEFFQEDTRWNGSNHVSVHTSGEFTHQGLYRTAGGRWVLDCWSQWEGSTETYEFITDERAREWLLINSDDEVAERFFGPVEEERGPGRPEIGPAVNLRFPQELLDRIDAAAKGEGISRAEKIRRLVAAGMS